MPDGPYDDEAAREGKGGGAARVVPPAVLVAKAAGRHLMKAKRPTLPAQLAALFEPWLVSEGEGEEVFKVRGDG